MADNQPVVHLFLIFNIGSYTDIWKNDQYVNPVKERTKYPQKINM
jgi:hypothetical protein